MTTLRNGFDGGTSGTAISTGDSGDGNALDVTQLATGAVRQYSNTHVFAGGLAMKVNTSTTSGQNWVGWTTSLFASGAVSGAELWLECYCYFTANPGTAVIICGGRNAGNNRGMLAISTTGKLQLRDASNTVQATFTNSIPLNQWFRVGFYMLASATVGKLEGRLWSTATAAYGSETEVQTLTAQNTGADIERALFGLMSNVTSFPDTWFDSIAASTDGRYPSQPATISPTAIASAEAFGTAVVATSAQTVSPTAIASAEAFGSDTLSPGPVSVSPAGVASAEAFGSLSLSPGPVSLLPSGVATAEAFGSDTITLGPVTLSPSGIASAEALGTAVVTPGPASVSPAGVASAEVFGTAVLTARKTLSPAGISTVEVIGDLVVIAGAVSLLPAGVASSEAFGSDTVSPGPVTVAPAGIATAEAVPGPVLTGGTALVLAAGIATAEAFGAPVLTHGPVAIAPAGIASAEALGAAALTVVNIIRPVMIDSAETFGATLIVPGPVIVSVPGIASAGAMGTAVLSIINVISGHSIQTQEVFGLPNIGIRLQILVAVGIPSQEAFGFPDLTDILWTSLIVRVYPPVDQPRVRLPIGRIWWTGAPTSGTAVGYPRA